jgi:ribose/xylose/arabinose/galactoside ABC-type transport system permease subunit
MMRIMFGAILGLLVTYPVLLAIVVSIASVVLVQPVVLAFTAGVILWPRLARTVRGWAR